MNKNVLLYVFYVYGVVLGHMTALPKMTKVYYFQSRAQNMLVNKLYSTT